MPVTERRGGGTSTLIDTRILGKEHDGSCSNNVEEQRQTHVNKYQTLVA